jgi:hypothetical protein
MDMHTKTRGASEGCVLVLRGVASGIGYTQRQLKLMRKHRPRRVLATLVLATPKHSVGMLGFALPRQGKFILIPHMCIELGMHALVWSSPSGIPNSIPVCSA